MVAIWLFKRTRPDPEVLAPLEVMSDRAWRRGDPVWQRRRLDEVRPAGAEPLMPSAAPPAVDDAFDQGPSGSGFDDLHDDAAAATTVDDDAGACAGAGAGAGADADDDGESVERASSTPVAQERPDLGDFSDLFDGDIDPVLLAAAMADLDAELRRNDIGTPTGTPRPGNADADADADLDRDGDDPG
jgi:hypothetical protein